MASKSNCYLTRPGGEKQGICMAGAGGLHFLTAVERTIIDAACAGKAALATGEVRVDLIRFLACGGDAACPVAPRGLEIHDAAVIGDLDLTNRTLPGNLIFRNCRFDRHIDLQGASTRMMDFGGSRCAGIDARGATISGDLKLDEDFLATGVV